MESKKIYFIGIGVTLIIFLVLPLLMHYGLRNPEGSMGIAFLVHFIVGPLESFILGIVYRSNENKIWIIVLLTALCTVLVCFMVYGGVVPIYFVSIVSLILGYTIGYYLYEKV